MYSSPYSMSSPCHLPFRLNTAKELIQPEIQLHPLPARICHAIRSQKVTSKSPSATATKLSRIYSSIACHFSIQFCSSISNSSKRSIFDYIIFQSETVPRIVMLGIAHFSRISQETKSYTMDIKLMVAATRSFAVVVLKQGSIHSYKLRSLKAFIIYSSTSRSLRILKSAEKSLPNVSIVSFSLLYKLIIRFKSQSGRAQT